jgi:hypothetical protein
MTDLIKTDERIEQDLQIIEIMVAEMPHYLKFEGVFYPLSIANFPRLTLGGYLMRQHRLLAIGDTLDTLTADRLATTTVRFRDFAIQNIVQIEQHANKEAQIRVHQWDTYLKELSQNPYEYEAYYTRHVEDRVMLKAIFDFLQPPYKLDPQAKHELDMLDFVLHGKWEDGDFIWAEIWQPAYSHQDNWWLYGRPNLANNKDN